MSQLNSQDSLLNISSLSPISLSHPSFSHPPPHPRWSQDFNLKKTVIVSDAKIFSEKQLREFTATYSTDERWNPFEALTGLINKGSSGSSAPSIAPTSVESALKSTISLAVLEEKTAAYVAGKINAGAYKKVLEVAFGDKLPSVLPQIKANLPAGKAKGL